MSSNLLVARSPLPISFHLLLRPKFGLIAGRGPRLKILPSQEFKSLKCFCVLKKSASQSDDDNADEDLGGKKRSRKPSRRSRKKAEASVNAEDDKTISVSDVDGEESSHDQSTSDDEKIAHTSRKQPRQPSSRISRKKTAIAFDNSDDDDETTPVSDGKEVGMRSLKAAALPENSTKVKKERRKKATPISDEVTETNISRRRTRKKSDDSPVESFAQLSDTEEPESFGIVVSEKEDMHTKEEDVEDISFTYEWPPLVCCFGAAQHAFIPSGRPSNRLIDHDIHETMKDMFWTPEKFVRAPGGSSSSVAVTLASLGGRVAFMGKLGDDEYGQSMLYHLNSNNVQTRAIRIDDTKLTGVSYMKMSRRGALRMTPVQPCAEDSLLSSEISTDVLKEAKMFYFNSSSLLDPNMRITTMQAIQTSKKFGGAIFYDLNLPLSLWQSRDDTIMFIQEAWNFADVIEVTKQELEFICGIEPLEKFDTKDNDRSKFTHYRPEVVMPLWHENLRVLFVTNGTSKIHYYTENDNGWVHGMEDAPITPFTADMSVSGDAIVAALMRMLSVQPHLITDEGYLKHTIKYAIDCGVVDQWLLARVWGFPPKEEIDGVRTISEREFRTVGPDID